MLAMKHNQMRLLATSNFATRGMIFVLVLAVHVTIFIIWKEHPGSIQNVSNEISVSLSMAAPETESVNHNQNLQRVPMTPPISPIVEPVSEEIGQAQVATIPVTAPTEKVPVVAPATLLVETQPDYKASYLNNPPPTYPLLARRNGLQGRVVLNVEVLANGSSGKVTVQSSSGYAMLDNAAIQTVMHWRFVAARRAGQVIDKWFMIPIQFSLKDNQA